MDGWRFDLYSAFHQDLKALNKTAKTSSRPMLISSLVTDRKEREEDNKGKRVHRGEGGGGYRAGSKEGGKGHWLVQSF